MVNSGRIKFVMALVTLAGVLAGLCSGTFAMEGRAVDVAQMGGAGHGHQPAVSSPGERVIYMAAIEPKGGVTVDKEPFPPVKLPEGGGYVKTPPNSAGRWEVSVYQFSPGTVVARQGERVTIEIVGINGDKHSVHVEKYHPEHVVVKRGEITRIQFRADEAGIFKIHCKEHEPSMEGALVVLPR